MFIALFPVSLIYEGAFVHLALHGNHIPSVVDQGAAEAFLSA